ncbi:hypothetical protein E8E12_003379 [Didymella heteroderae]|uniref:Phosphorelay sensor kinase n=1 Tax=Didymella heteroderae TaxID=1769908 RepID=A0A9P4WIB1_9PLEO|nr:hypothetical protein E8E12_003379 [Didymella heteroderae]
MFTQPKSIFTGATPSSTNPDDHRLRKSGYHEGLNPPPEGSQPLTPFEQPSSPLSTPPERPWSLKNPLDIFATTPRPSTAPSSGGEAFKAPQPVTTPPSVAGSKRSAPRTRDDAPATEPLHKRRRVHTRARHSLDLFNCASSRPLRYDGQPPSPLFFSSRRARPHLPARFSSSEAAARMLSKTRGEDGGIKTVTLARGTFSGLSPPGTTSVTSGRSSERSSIPRTSSPDVRDRNDPLKLLGSVGVVELLEHDTRPTFIVDIGDYANYAPDTSMLQILFANIALRSNASIWETVAGKPPEQPADEASSHASNQFRGWLLSTATHGDEWDANPTPVEHGGIVWSCYTLRKRLRIVSGATPPIAKAEIPSTSASVEFTIPSASSVGHFSGRTQDTASSSNQTGEQQDYFGPPATRENEEPNALNTMTHNHMNWASTALGPIEFWSNDLRAMCNLIMASPHPAAMYWGEELVAIYNEAYIGLAGQKHPTLMGQSYKVAWAEIWDEVKDVFQNARLTGQATMKDDDCLFMKRSGFLEETYFSWSIIPMVGEDGTVMGLYNPAFEKTRRKIAERRMLTLREVGERTATARDVKGFWDQVLIALTENEFDTPFVMLYSVSDESDSDSSSLHSSSLLGAKHCILEGSLGVPCGHQAAPDHIDLKEGHEGFGPVFREVMKTDKPAVISIGSGDLPSSMMDGLEWRGFGDACRDVVVCPIHPTTGETILGFLVMGVNPRRPYDDDYNLFVQLLSRQLATSLASVVLFEEEIRRGQKAAKLAAEDRYNLSTQLAARTQEARENELRFTRMAEYSPAGLFIADHAGRITYCNDTWFEISRVPKERNKTDRWIDYVKEEDQNLIQEHWKRLVENTAPINVEFRFKAPWEDRNNNATSDTWVLFSAFPEKDESGQLKSVFGSITNISPQKWAEGFQKRKMEEAVELKRQQENFIDITSHEMRNPLSAILQCADEISTTLGEFRQSGLQTIEPGIVADSIDAAQTIALCAQHQKRIVDDVLTLSKLDSAMLMVTPVDAQPLQVIQRALKMFEGEVQTAGIHMEFVLSDSFKKLNIDWVKIDPSRVLQVLINLTTNAIKFTSTEETRTITVVLAASTTRPSANKYPAVSYFPMKSKRIDQTLGPDWGNGEEIFLEFLVQDTGRGLSAEELKLLFQRFSQASPRTHVQYGGSGLGLFISRELTELQGGEIGVSSKAGKGSTFAFYVKGRRSSEPREAIDSVPAAVTLSRKVSNARDTKRPEPPKIKDFATQAPAPLQTPAPLQALASLQASAPLEPEEPKLPYAHLRVLIVEDNLVNQKVLQRQLSNRGISTTVANHGGEAITLLSASSYHASSSPNAPDLGVVLMDKEMPVMDGLACTSKIRDMERKGELRRHVPIIAVTANARSEQIATLLAAGMDDVVSKPFRIGELVPKIEELSKRYSFLKAPQVLQDLNIYSSSIRSGRLLRMATGPTILLISGNCHTPQSYTRLSEARSATGLEVYVLALRSISDERPPSGDLETDTALICS